MTVMLYNDPHPVNRAMADSIGAGLIQAELSGPHLRLKSALTSSYNGNVILEGGAPLLEGALLKSLGQINGKLILLAADETLINIKYPLDHYSSLERHVHRQSLRAVDGTIAISETLADIARQLTGKPAVVAQPFVLDSLGQKLDTVEPDLESNRVLSVAEHRPANNLRELRMACALTDAQLTLVGKGTEKLDGEGFVDEDELVGHFSSSSLFCFPATAQAFGIAPVESMRAGVPPLTSAAAGVAEVVAKVDEHLIVDPQASQIAPAIRWYLDLDLEDKQELSNRSREVANSFNETDGRQRFKQAYKELLSRI